MSAPPHINDSDIPVVADSRITALFCDCGAHRRSVFSGDGTFECTEMAYIPPAVRSMFTTTTHQDPAAIGQKRTQDGPDAGQQPTSNYAKAIEYATDETLVQDDKIMIVELIQWLLPNSAKHVDDETIKKSVQRCSSKIECPDEPVCSDGLF